MYYTVYIIYIPPQKIQLDRPGAYIRESPITFSQGLLDPYGADDFKSKNAARSLAFLR